MFPLIYSILYIYDISQCKSIKTTKQGSLQSSILTNITGLQFAHPKSNIRVKTNILIMAKREGDCKWQPAPLAIWIIAVINLADHSSCTSFSSPYETDEMPGEPSDLHVLHLFVC